MANFNSAYNVSANYVQRPPIYMPVSTSASFSSVPTRSDLKFNLDLYNPHGYSSASSFEYPSPSSSVIIHHHPVHSPPPLPPPPSQAISKLRQINDELCYALAQCDLDSQTRAPAPHHHIYHYPISPGPSRSPSPRAISSSSSESEPIPKRRNARMTYKTHVPRRPNPLNEVDHLLLTTSDVYERDDPMTIDIYPTRDQGFIRKIRNRPDNQQPWFPDSPPLRRNSYSENSTYRTPRGPDYNNRPITPSSRLASGKVRPRSSSVKSRIRPETAPINLLRQSADPFSSIAPVWRPNGSIKRPKFIGSHEPPRKPRPTSEPTWNPGGTAMKKKEFRALDPTSKSITRKHEPVWHPPPINPTRKPMKYFEPSMKPELMEPIQQTAPLMRKKTVIPNANPMLKTRIAKAESKVKSAWTEPTTTVVKPKPPIAPRPIKTTTIPPKPKLAPVRKPIPAAPVRKPVPAVIPAKIDTGRSSLNDVPSKPMFESTPRTQSPIYDGGDLFEEDTQISTPSKTPKTPIPEPNPGVKPTIKNDVLVQGDRRTPSPEITNRDEEEEEEEPSKNESVLPAPVPAKPKTPSPVISNRDEEEDEPSVNQNVPPPKPKTPSPKPDHRDDASIIDEEEINHDDADQPSVQNPEIHDTAPSPTPRARDLSPAPSIPPAATTTAADDIDNFFD